MWGYGFIRGRVSYYISWLEGISLDVNELLKVVGVLMIVKIF